MTALQYIAFEDELEKIAAAYKVRTVHGFNIGASPDKGRTVHGFNIGPPPRSPGWKVTVTYPKALLRHKGKALAGLGLFGLGTAAVARALSNRTKKLRKKRKKR